MELLDIFKRHIASKDGSASKNTVKNYVSDIRHFISWFEKTTNSTFHESLITGDSLKLYERTLGGKIENSVVLPNTQLSTASMKRHLSSLRKFFTFAQQSGKIENNPFTAIAPEVVDTPTDYWHLGSFKNSLNDSKASRITVKNYISDIQSFAKWYEEAILPTLENPLTRAGGFYLITQNILEDYRKRLIEIQNAAPRTINRKLSSIRKYLSFAAKEGFIEARELTINPVNTPQEQLPVSKENQIALKDIQQAIPQPKKYSKIPPVRLFQKLVVFPYLLLEDKSSDIIAGIIAGKPVTGFTKLPSSITSQLRDKNILRSQNQSINSLLGIKNVQKEFYAPDRISLLGQPLHKRLIFHARFTRPEWYKKYHNIAFVHYAHLALLVVFASGVGVALYNNLVLQKQTPTFAAPTAPPRILSFQGRLTDANDNPITSSTNLRFAIYNDATASGGALLWQEVNGVTPDQDGIFSIYLGGGTSISSTVFTDNSSIFLGVSVLATPELTPRQRIATVGYATNSEFLQGQPPTTQAGITSYKNVILALDSSGNLNLSDSVSTDHIFQVNNGNFKLTGQTLQLATNLNSGGNVSITPDGLGKIDLSKPLVNNSNNGNITPGGVEINDRFGILATESAVAAFIVNNNTTGGDIFAASSSGTTRFVIANDGTLTSSIYTAQNGVLYGTQTTGVIAQATTSTSGLCLQSGGSTPTWGTCGGASYWNIALGALAPYNDTLDLLVGGQTTASAKFRFLNNNAGTPVASISANSTNNASFLAGDGTLGTTNRQTLTIGNSSTYNTTGNLLFNPNGVGRIGIFTNNPLVPFDLRGNSGTQAAASISARTSFATLIVDNAGVGDLITASAAGVPNFIVRNNGDIVVGQNGSGKITAAVVDPYLVQNQKTTGITSLTFQTMGASNADFIFLNQSTLLSTLTQAGQLQLPITGSTGGLVLGGDTQIYRGAADRIDVATGDSINLVSGSLQIGGVTVIDASRNGSFNTLNVTGGCTGCTTGAPSPFQELAGAIVPLNSTLDFLVGGQSTASAKFGVLNLSGGTPTASISANSGDNATFVTGNGNLGTVNAQTLTLGGSTTGNIILQPSNGAGRLGIGTATPDSTIQVVTQSGDAILNLSGNTTTQRIRNNGNEWLAANSGLTVMNALLTMELRIAGAAKLYIDSSGNVGIGNGTVAPTAKLDVTGNASVSGTIKTPTIQSTANQTLTLGGDTTGQILLNPSNSSGMVTVNGKLGLVATTTFDATFEGLQTMGLGDLSVLARGDLRFNIDTNGNGNNSLRVFANGNSTEVFRIQDDGLVGIGTTSPTALLDVAGTASVSGALKLYGTPTIQSTAKQSLTLGGDTTGNILLNPNGTGFVGIGTSNPTVPLEIASSSLTTLLKITPLTGTVGDSGYIQVNSRANFGYDGVRQGLDIWAPAGKVITFDTNSNTQGANERARFDASGNFGLGNTAPNSILDVQGTYGKGNALAIFNQTQTGGSPDILSASASGTTRFTIANNGTLTASAYTTNGGLLYTNGSGVVSQTGAGSVVQCLLGGTTPTWGPCTSASNSPFTTSLGAIVPLNTSLDFLIGGQSTASAKFAVLNIANGTPTTSVSGNLIVQADNGNGGFVGIGTNNPQAPLHVARTQSVDPIAQFSSSGAVSVYLSGGAGSQKLFVSNGANNFLTGTQAGDSGIVFNLNTNYFIGEDTQSPRMFFQKGTGNIGVGTVTPTALLDVAGTASVSGVLKLYGTPTIQSTAKQSLTLGGDTTGNILLNPSGTGNVGIGTSSPASKLELGSGQLALPDGTAGAPSLAFSGALDMGIYRTTTNLGFSVGGSAKMFLVSTALRGSSNDTFNIATATRTSTTPTYSWRNDEDTGLGSSGANSLSLTTGGVERVNLDSNGYLGIGTNTQNSQLFVTRALSQGVSGKALTIFDQIENQDIFTASAAGVTKFTITNSGGIALGGSVGSGTQCLLGGTTASWGACANASNSPFTTSLGAIIPLNSSLDFLIGGQATASAKFGVLNIAGGTPTASVSSGLSGTAAFFDAAGNFQTANKQALTLGGATTGNINLVPNGGSGSIFANGDTLIGSGKNFVAGQTTGKVGFGSTVSGSDYLVDITADSTQDWSRALSITQSNDSQEANVTGINLTSTPNYGSFTGSGTVNTYGISQTITPTVTFNTASGVAFYNTSGSRTDVNIGNITYGNSGGTASTTLNYGSYTSLTGSPTISDTDTNGTNNISGYGMFGTVSITPTWSGSTDTFTQNTYAGIFTDSSTAPNDALVTANSYGIHVTNSGNLTTGGTTTKYGGYFDITGTADTSYGLYLNGVASGTTNTGLYIGTIAAASGNYSLYSNAAAQSFISSNLGIGTSSPISQLHVTRPLTLAVTGKALGIFDQLENQDIFTASASGTTRFTIANNGTLTAPAYTTNGGLLYTNGSGVLAQTGAGGGTQCLLGGTTPTFGSCTGNGYASPFRDSGGVIFPLNSTEDFLLGGQATASAKFGIINLNSGNPTATISGTFSVVAQAGSSPLTTINQLNGGALAFQVSRGGDNGLSTSIYLANNGTVGIGQLAPKALLDVATTASIGSTLTFYQNTGATPTIATTGKLSLVLGGSTTGNILLNPTAGSLVGIGTSNPTSGLTVFGGNSGGNAALSVNQIGVSTNDIFTASASGTTRFTIGNNGNITATGTLTGLTGLTLASGGITVGGTVGSGTQCLLGGASASWGSCGSSSTSPFVYTNSPAGAIAAANSTMDLLIGGQSTASAKFAVLNISGSGPAIASVSGNLVIMPNNGAGGKVGIGTMTPGDKLALAGGNFAHTASGNPVLKGTLDTSGTSEAVYVSGRYAYVADGNTGGLVIVDISNPSTPVQVGRLATGGARGIHVAGRYAYLAANTADFKIVDVSNPLAPQLMSTLTVTNDIQDVYVVGKYAYLANNTPLLQIVDISNPSNPVITGSVSTTGIAVGVVVSGKYAYVADNTSGLQIVDISNPYAPTIVGTVDTGTSTDVYVLGRYAYVSDTVSGIQVVDLKNINTPTIVGTLALSGSPQDIYVAGGYAYVAAGSAGLTVVDISTPTAPSLVGTYDTSGSGNGVFLAGKYAYVADGSSGLQVIDINGISTPSLFAGSLRSDTLTVTDNGLIGNNLYVENGLNVGIGGILSEGALSIRTASGAANLIEGAPTGMALLTLNQMGSQALFTASASGTTRFVIQNDGNVGIGTNTPVSPLHVFKTGINDPLATFESGSGGSVWFTSANQTMGLKIVNVAGADNFTPGTQAGDSGIVFNANGNFVIGGEGSTQKIRFIMKPDGRLGINTVQSPTGINPTAMLQIFSNQGTTPGASISAQTSSAALLVTNDGVGDILVGSQSGAFAFRFFKDQTDSSHDVTLNLGNAGKLNALDVDPPYTIDGVKYSTYAPSTFLPTEEYTGKATLAYDPQAGAYAYKLDFNNFQYQSDLWVFNRIINPDIGFVKVFMTPNSQARTWYQRNGNSRTITLFADRPSEVSFRLTANRVDFAKYSTVNKNDGPIGLVVPPPPAPNGSSATDNNINSDHYFNSLTINQENGQYVLKDANNNNIYQTEAFSKAIIATVKAGLVDAKKIVTGTLDASVGYIATLTGNTLSFSQATFSTLSSAVSNLGNATATTLAVATESVTIGGQNIKAFIINTVRDAGFANSGTISPLAQSEIKTNNITPLSDNKVAVKGNLAVEGNASDSANVALTVTGAASISGALASASIQTGDATVSGTLRVNNIEANTIAGLNDKISSIASSLIASNQPTQASTSGSFSGGNIAVNTVNANFGIFEQGITSMGPVTANIITATDSLSIGSNFSISNNAINTVGSDLELQSLRQGNIAFQGGLIKMDTDGNMSITGNMNVMGEIDAVFGVFSGSLTTQSLATGLISPLGGGDLTIQLKDGPSTPSGKLKIKDNSGREVLSINSRGDIASSGSASLSKLNFNLVGEAQASSLTEAVATGSAGFATLRQGQPEITIKNPNVTSKSLIYITPFGDTNNKVLYLLRQTPATVAEGGSFTVGISGQSPATNIQFNWLIVN